MQPIKAVHEIKDGLHRLIINDVSSRWEPELLPCKVKLIIEEKEYTYFASADIDSGLPEIFMAVSIYGNTLVAPANDKNLRRLTIDDL